MISPQQIRYFTLPSFCLGPRQRGAYVRCRHLLRRECTFLRIRMRDIEHAQREAPEYREGRLRISNLYLRTLDTLERT